MIKDKTTKDKELFNKITEKYALKDTVKSSRKVRKRRIVSIIHLLDKEKIKNIVEIGCGIGAPYEYLKELIKIEKYTGLDHSEEMIKNASMLYNDMNNVEFICEDATKYEGYKDADLILSIGVLHHIENVDTLLIEIFKKMKCGSQIIIIEPNDNNILIRGLRNIRKVIDKSYSSEQVFFKPEILLEHIKNAGFKEIKYEYREYFSTPFGEVILKPLWLFDIIVRISILLDKGIEKIGPIWLKKQSWNITVVATKEEPLNE